MAVLPIYVAPHPVLKKVAEPVTGGVTDKLRKLMDDMVETMYAAHGIGLAAPQVGQSLRVIVMDIDQREAEDGAKGRPRYFVNPEITWTSDEQNTYNEGCLSVPDQFAEVERPRKVKLKYIDYDGKTVEEEADGLFATCIQHEIDHLNGVLFVDHLSTLKRDMLLRKVRKWVRDNADEASATHVL
jgi:peptide deformylase